MSRIVKVAIPIVLCIGLATVGVSLLEGKRPMGGWGQEQSRPEPTPPTTSATALSGAVHVLAPPDLQADYKMRRRDIISVRVAVIPSDGTATFTSAMVGPDGTIFVPGLGKIPAAGCTTATLGAAIVDAFARRGRKVGVYVRVRELALPTSQGTR